MPVEGVSRDDPLPPEPKDEPEMEVTTRGSRLTNNRRIAWMDSPLTKYANAITVGRRLFKRRNMDFLLGESNVVVDIRDDDAWNLS